MFYGVNLAQSCNDTSVYVGWGLLRGRIWIAVSRLYGFERKNIHIIHANLFILSTVYHIALFFFC